MLRRCMEEYQPIQRGQAMNKFSILTNTSVNKNYHPEVYSHTVEHDPFIECQLASRKFSCRQGDRKVWPGTVSDRIHMPGHSI